MHSLLLTYDCWTKCKELQHTKKSQICNLEHPTSGYIPKKDGASTNDTEKKQGKKQGGDNVKINLAEMDLKSASASITSNVISISVVPVKVSYVRTKKQTSAYAILENWSQGCFIKDSIREDLGVDGRKIEITTKTLHGEQGEVNSDVKIET